MVICDTLPHYRFTFVSDLKKYAILFYKYAIIINAVTCEKTYFKLKFCVKNEQDVPIHKMLKECCRNCNVER